MWDLVVVALGVETRRRPATVLLREPTGGRYLPLPAGTGSVPGQREPAAPVRAGLLDEVLRAVGAPARWVEVLARDAGARRCALVVGDGVRVALPPLEAVSLAFHLDLPIRCADAVLEAEGAAMSDVDVDREWRFAGPVVGGFAGPAGGEAPGQADLTAPMGPIAGPAGGDASGVPEGPAGPVFLELRRGPGAGSMFPLDTEVVTCGRDASNQIVLDDVTVSRKHAELYRREGGYVVSDLGSLNGTYVNGERVRTAILAAGDEIRIGRYAFAVGSAGARTADRGSWRY